MAADRIRMAVAGLGRIGWPFHCAQLARHPEFEFVAVQDLEPARRAEAERTYGVKSFQSFSQMLKESRLDAVAIATPTHLHRAMSVEALRAGCHVMLEKPMAPDAAEASVIVREAARQKKILTVYQPRRADAYFQHLRALIDSGIIGRLYHVRIGMFQFTIRNDWQALRRYGGGMINNYGAHALDQLLQLIGYDVKRVFCNLRIVASVGDAEDVVKIVIQTQKGMVGEVDINQAVTSNPWFLHAFGTRGTISIPPEDQAHLTVRHFDSVPETRLNESLASADRQYPGGDVQIREEVIPVDESLAVDVYADLARAIRGESKPFVSAEEPLAVMKLIAQCRAEAGVILPTRIVERPGETARSAAAGEPTAKPAAKAKARAARKPAAKPAGKAKARKTARPRGRAKR